jgi:hypothetical protein
MKIQHLAIVNVLLSPSALLIVAALNGLGYLVERYDESLAVYYDSKGVAVLYNIAC